MVLFDGEESCAKSFRNLAGVAVLHADDVGVADLVGAGRIVISEAALGAPDREGGGQVNARQVIIRPVISEKSYALLAANKYTFRVHERANKTQVRQAVEEIFGVRVTGVRTAWVKPKPKRRGLSKGTRRQWKKAIVTLHPDDSIELFEGQEALDGHQEAQAHLARPALRHLAPARGRDQDRAREGADRGAAQVRRAQLATGA